MNTITEEQYRQLKKYAFLFIGDEKQADEIVQKTISKCARKILEVPDKEVEAILRNPDAFQKKYRNIKIRFISRFPYGIHYRFEKNEIVVIGVFHTSRSPKNWSKRLGF